MVKFFPFIGVNHLQVISSSTNMGDRMPITELEEEKKDRKKMKDKLEKEENETKIDEKKDEATNSIDILPTGVIDLLAAIAHLQVRHTEVHVSLGTLKALGYGPKEWKLSIKDSCAQRYIVLRNTEGHDSLVVKDPLFGVSFSNIDGLLDELIRLVREVMSLALIIYKEPESVGFNGAICANPDDLGIPYAAMSSNEIPLEQLQNRMQPFCNLERDANPNFSRGYIAEGIPLLPTRVRLLDQARQNMRIMRTLIEEQFRYVMDGQLFDKELAALNPSDLLHITANPFGLNRFFDHIPRPMAYSANMLCEILAPEVVMTPMASSQILQLGGQSANRLNTLNSFSNVGYNPTMQPEISAFIISLLCPGYINFSIELDDLGESDPYLSCLAAIFAKMLFSYSDQRRWNSLTENSINVTETAILRAALQASIANTQVRGIQGRPLDNMIPVRNANLNQLAVVRTTDAGGGWREAGRAVFADRPPMVQYLECQDRPLYVCDIDNLNNVPDQVIEEVYGAWHLRQALYELLASMSRGRAHKTSIAGAEGVFNALSRRLLDFFIEINDYNRKNWYTSLRLTNDHMDRIYEDATEAPCVVPIKGKTILFLFRSLAKNTIQRRRASYLSQVNLECAMARDLIESGAKSTMFERALVRYEIPRNMFTSNDVLSKNEPPEGPLREIFSHIRAAGFGTLVGNYFDPVNDAPMSEIYHEIIELILANAISFGISEEVFMHPSLMRGRREYMRALADAGRPHTTPLWNVCLI